LQAVRQHTFLSVIFHHGNHDENYLMTLINVDSHHIFCGGIAQLAMKVIPNLHLTVVAPAVRK